MKLSYRARQNLRYAFIGALIFLLIAIVVWMIWIIWLDRFVVYTRDGAQLDFDRPTVQFSGEAAAPPQLSETVSIYYNEGDNEISISNELTTIHGYYADTTALRKSVYAVREQIEKLPRGTPIMLDMKNIAGQFHYSTAVGSKTSGRIDIEAMDSLLEYLRGANYYTIARIPAFRDYDFGLNNVPYGLTLPSGIGLWMDDTGCYWLDPTSDGTLNYLIQIVNELKALGFDEVVFTDFCFPDTEKIKFDGDRTTAINNAAESLAIICSSSTFCVSFVSDDPLFRLPDRRCRLYRTGVAAADVRYAAEASGVADPAINLVFLTETNDTRYDDYCVLRPLDSANFD
jgi:hypothetical protein